MANYIVAEFIINPLKNFLTPHIIALDLLLMKKLLKSAIRKVLGILIRVIEKVFGIFYRVKNILKTGKIFFMNL